MDGSETQKTRVCPVCDEAVSADVVVCPSCSTDLTLFSAEDTASGDVGPEELKRSLLSGENGHLSELMKAAEDGGTLPPNAKPVEIVYGDMVECPGCGKSIAADAMKCLHCGVEFEMDEMFECPMCATLLEVTVTKCPSCGAEFEDESQTSAEPVPEPAVVEVKPPEPPAPEVKAAPVSFVDRLKQVKDEPGSAQPPPPKPQRELSFAERMKAMRDGKNPDETAKGSVTPSPSEPVPAGSETTAVPKPAPQSAAPAPETVPAKPPQAEPTKNEQYKDLPVHIGEVKKLLIMANELKLDVSTSKAVINRAITAGKNRDLESAIKLVREGKAGIEREIRSVLLSKLKTLETAIGLEKRSGKDVSDMEIAIEEAKKSLEAGDFPPASEALKSLEAQIMSSSPSKLSEAEMDTVGCAIVNAEFLNLAVVEPKSLYEEAKKAAAQNDMQKSIQFTKKANESLNRILPAYIASEMRKAKITLRDIKMMNVDIATPVQLLKEANDQVLHGDYCSALAHIKEFKDFVRKVEQDP